MSSLRHATALASVVFAIVLSILSALPGCVYRGRARGRVVHRPGTTIVVVPSRHPHHHHHHRHHGRGRGHGRP